MKTERIELRVTEEEKRSVLGIAEGMGMTVSELLLSCVIGTTPVDQEVPCPQEVIAPPNDPWHNRGDGLRCKSCIWFVPKPPHALGRGCDVGRCRRHAPTMGGYPAVFVNDWCGDHKIDENKL
jgi:hypothetical protein